MSVTAELLEAVRGEARPDTWSAGMGLARAGAVSVQSVGEEEAVLRVRATGRPAPLTTVLYPEDEVWECDCRGRVDPCEHVVAAAIILHHSVTQRAPASRASPARPAPAQTGPRPGSTPKPERMVYRFKRVEGGLQLERLLVRPDNTARLLARSLSGLLTNPTEAARIQVEPCDLLADKLLLKPTKGALPPERLNALLARAGAGAHRALRRRAGVRVERARAPARHRGGSRRADGAQGGEGSAHHRAGVPRRRGERGIALPARRAGSHRREAGAPPAGARLLARADWRDLTGKVLPDFARRMPVDVRSQRLPRIDRTLEPRISVELNQLDTGLSVLPTLVYGAPPSVRIDNGRMVYLRARCPCATRPPSSGSSTSCATS